MSRTREPAAAPRDLMGRAALIGPGLVLAATGVGAGDLVAAAVSGARYGYTVIWAAVAGALLKFVLSEGLARWQLATGSTLIEGWARHLGRWVQYLFLGYLVVWSFVVGGALISATGLAAHAIAPGLSVNAWGVIHSLVGAAVVLVGGYEPFEKLIKVFIGLMFVSLVGSALFVAPPLETLSRVVSEAGLPGGGIQFVLAVIGGVGGSVTLLSYGYWIREKGWEGPRWVGTVRLDLAVAYTLTGVFGLAVMTLAAQVLHGHGAPIAGSRGVLEMAGMLEPWLGKLGRWTFLVGFWGAVATSLLGVWQGIPYLFCDFIGTMRGSSDFDLRASLAATSPWYRGFLAWLCLPPLLLLYIERPVALIVAYSALGALFMPFLSGTLLYLNSRERWVGRLRNGPLSSLFLVTCLLLFGLLAVLQLIELFRPDNA